MRYFIIIFYFLLHHLHLTAQCECTDCPVFVPSNTTQSSFLNISGASNNDLGSATQGLCRICIDLDTDAIQELFITLYAPNGSSVTLATNTGININSNINFSICFVACSDSPTPDPGFPSTFDSSAGYNSNSNYTGSYYPNVGCLEDLTGSVDGNWTLEIQDLVGGDDSTLNDWYLVFENDTGIGCANSGECGSSCAADAGDIVLMNNPACPSGTVSFEVQNYNSSYEQYILITNPAGEIIDFINGDNYDYTYNYCQVYQVYSYNYDPFGGSTVPSIGDFTSTYDCIANCCELIAADFAFADGGPPYFTYVPEHPNFPSSGGTFIIDCLEDLPPLEQAEYDDDCIEPGLLDAVEVFEVDPCYGGTVTRTWSIGDSCTIQPTIEEQIIIIDPIPIAQYINPPGDINVTCGNVPQSSSIVNYTNGLVNSCASDGFAIPFLTEDYDACGGLAYFTWSAFDACGREILYIQNIFVDSSSPPEYIDPPADITISCDNIPTFGPDLILTNSEDPLCLIEANVTPVVINNYSGCEGEVIIEWNHFDICGTSHIYQQKLTVEPPPSAEFISTPSDITISCGELDSISTTLALNNGSSGTCEISDEIEAIIIGNIDTLCGGTLTYLWEYTDGCDRYISYSQDIEIASPPKAVFIDPPSSDTINCGEIENLMIPISFTNNLMNNCQIMGSVNPSIQGDYDESCGGNIMINWELIDSCGRSTNHSQSVLVLPPADPNFLNIPNDTILDCGVTNYSAPSLAYSNGLIDSCLLQGFVDAKVNDMGSFFLVEWTYTHPCTDSTITATQTINLSNSPSIALSPKQINYCVGDSFNLNTLSVVDTNSTGAIISFHTGIPNSNNLLNDSIVSPIDSSIYYVLLTTVDNCTDYDSILIVPEIENSIAEDGFGSICKNDSLYNLYDYIFNISDSTGVWIDLDNSGIDLSNPDSISIENISADTYTFLYTHNPVNSCPADSVYASISIYDNPNISIESINCSNDLMSYDIIISTNDDVTINADIGMVNLLASNQFSITNIPSMMNVTIIGINNITDCSTELLIDAPDCSCPSIAAPINLGDKTLCLSSLPTSLVVGLGNNQTANWYDSPTDGNLLLSGAPNYSPTISSAGVYTYYVEAVDLDNTNCTSSIRTPISLTVLAAPEIMISSYSSCIDYNSNTALVVLNTLNGLISDDSNNLIEFYQDNNDAVDQINPLVNNFEISDGNSVIISIRITDENGCFSIGNLELTPLPYPEADLIISPEICLDDENGAISIIPFNGVNGLQSSLNGQAYTDTLSYSNLASQDFNLSIIDANNCENNYDFTINDGLALTFNFYNENCFDNDTGEDLDDDFYLIDLSIFNSLSFSSFQLSLNGLVDGIYNYNEVLQFNFPADNTSILFTIEDINTGCILEFSTSDLSPCSTPCTIFPDATIFVDPSNIINCVVQSVDLSSSDEPNVVYNWFFNNSPLDDSELFGIDEEGLVVLIAIDSISGCSSTDSLFIIDLVAYPIVSLISPDTIDCINTSVTIDGSNSDNGSQFINSWYYNSLNQGIAQNSDSIEVSLGGWYYMEVIDTTIGCINVDSVFVEENIANPNFSIQSDVIDCGTINSFISIENLNINNSSIIWYTNNGNIISNPLSPIVEVSSTGTYYVEVTDLVSRCVSLDSIQYTALPFPAFGLVESFDENCPGATDGSISFEAIDNGNQPYNFYLNNEAIYQLEINDLEPGSYNLIIEDRFGCQSDSTITIGAAELWTIILPVEIEFINQTNNTINAQVNLDPQEIQNISWSPSTNLSCTDCLNPTITATGIEEYTLSVTDVNGCLSEARVIIKYADLKIYLPNIFSPNGDGKNDHFVIRSNENLVDLEISIYDRWGNLIFDKNNLHDAPDEEFWDGSYNSERLNPGVYVYTYKAYSVNGDIIEGHGDITLIR